MIVDQITANAQADPGGWAESPGSDGYADAQMQGSTQVLMPQGHIPAMVIDTQVVMDWLVFGEAAVATLVTAIERREVRWLGTLAMKAELLHVLDRGVAAAWHPNLGRIHAAFSEWCESWPDMPPRVERLLCRDADDQMFIDLAIAAHCNWLISRDRAVLALSKRARAFGLEIVKPEIWIKHWTAGARPP